MLELILIPSLLGLGLAIDFIASDKNDADEPPVEITMDDDAVRFDGTDARDHVTGNALDNIFVGDAGNDLLSGLDGDDTLNGGIGDDRLFGGDDDDTALGGEGDDRIFLGDGDDTTQPSVEDGQDAGDDFIRGGAGADTLIDSRGSNQIFGDIHNDTIVTIDGLTADGDLDPTVDPDGTADTVHAGYGDDTLVGDDGDVLTGGIGNDAFVITGASTAPGAPVVVTDFDLRDDLFSVIFIEETPQDPTVTFTFDSDANILRAHVDGQEVATLAGLTQADIPFINTFVTTLPELMDQAA